MGRQIIKQPNGKYCIFSSIVDNITYYNMEAEDIIELWADESKRQIEGSVKETIAQLEKGERPHYSYMVYDEMLLLIYDVHSKKEMEKVKKLIENESAGK